MLLNSAGGKEKFCFLFDEQLKLTSFPARLFGLDVNSDDFSVFASLKVNKK